MIDVKWIKLSTNMFDDEKIKLIESMPDADSMLVIWIKLLAQAGKTNASGYIYLNENIPYTEEMLSTIFNRPLLTVRMALQTFQNFGMLEMDENSFLSISNWEKHQNTDGLDKIREQNRLRKQRQREKPRIGEGSNGGHVTGHVTVTQGHATDIDIDIDKEKELPSKPTQKQVFEDTSDYYILAKYMDARIKLNNPNFKNPNYQKWADDFRKIIELDKRDKREVSKLIKWVQQDDFETTNVLSPAKLRKRYDQLIMKMNKDQSVVSSTTANNSNYKDLGGREY